MKYKISEEAVRDIENVWFYTFENWSLEQADRYFNLIMDEIQHIVNNPKSGKDFSKVRKGYFRTQIKSHFIFYTYNEEKNIVDIIRILHQRMDTDSHLKK